MRTSLYPDATELTPEARARLSTLADHTELGSGFAIAMRDLEIRGAGELLGREQSGHVAAVGFELYVDLLNEAVEELAGGKRIVPRPVRIDARIDAYVPADYVSSEALKIDLHRRLALAATDEELRELHAAVEDRYGPPPDPVENLFALQEARSGWPRSAPTTRCSATASSPSGRCCSVPRTSATSARPSPPRRTDRPSRALDEDRRVPRWAAAARCYPRCAPGSLRRFFHSMNAHRVLLSASLAVAVTALSLGHPPAAAVTARRRRPASGVVASVAGDEITQAELDEVIAQAEGRLESQGQKIPAAGSQEYQAFQQNALAYLVQRVQFEQQAESSTSSSPTRRSTSASRAC